MSSKVHPARLHGEQIINTAKLYPSIFPDLNVTFVPSGKLDYYTWLSLNKSFTWCYFKFHWCWNRMQKTVFNGVFSESWYQSIRKVQDGPNHAITAPMLQLQKLQVINYNYWLEKLGLNSVSLADQSNIGPGPRFIGEKTNNFATHPCQFKIFVTIHWDTI